MQTPMENRDRFKPDKFFFSVLTHQQPEYVMDYIEGLNKEVSSIDKQIREIAIYSEGSISLTEAAMLSYEDRENIILTMNKRMEKMSGKEFM